MLIQERFLNFQKPFYLIYIKSSAYRPLVTPLKRETTSSTTKMKNTILAKEAAPAAMPPKPKIPAIIAITKNVIVQRNISVGF
ncbi:hypothetical protein MB14_17905 [Roseivirga ehrenbergii]|uniref:Uncharacterized protein n=1 Tax=Roseivirga ehrenbergii (strain DSM 102268 / JCM 13514 / KCTC 12282 / NCIMB 14502 / KMM 6017) TaxID=279360 RepID=A0A150XIW1_ROSEK|nr:hypothetical protein MB14_17905 [Roseivirga ehrenbergii]